MGCRRPEKTRAYIDTRKYVNIYALTFMCIESYGRGITSGSQRIEAGMVPFVVMSEQDQFIEAFKALADPVRMRILALLWRPDIECCSKQDRLCACDLEVQLGLTQSTVSHHMKALVRSGLVLATKEGRWIYYNINRYSFSAMSGFLSKYSEDVSVATIQKKVRATQPKHERYNSKAGANSPSTKSASTRGRRNPATSNVA
jgi:ArsR family transcriptional regulator